MVTGDASMPGLLFLLFAAFLMVSGVLFVVKLVWLRGHYSQDQWNEICSQYDAQSESLITFQQANRQLRAQLALTQDWCASRGRQRRWLFRAMSEWANEKYALECRVQTIMKSLLTYEKALNRLLGRSSETSQFTTLRQDLSEPQKPVVVNFDAMAHDDSSMDASIKRIIRDNLPDLEISEEMEVFTVPAAPEIVHSEQLDELLTDEYLSLSSVPAFVGCSRCGHINAVTCTKDDENNTDSSNSALSVQPAAAQAHPTMHSVQDHTGAVSQHQADCCQTAGSLTTATADTCGGIHHTASQMIGRKTCQNSTCISTVTTVGASDGVHRRGNQLISEDTGSSRETTSVHGHGSTSTVAGDTVGGVQRTGSQLRYSTFQSFTGSSRGSPNGMNGGGRIAYHAQSNTLPHSLKVTGKHREAVSPASPRLTFQSADLRGSATPAVFDQSTAQSPVGIRLPSLSELLPTVQDDQSAPMDAVQRNQPGSVDDPNLNNPSALVDSQVSLLEDVGRPLHTPNALHEVQGSKRSSTTNCGKQREPSDEPNDGCTALTAARKAVQLPTQTADAQSMSGMWTPVRRVASEPSPSTAVGSNLPGVSDASNTMLVHRIDSGEGLPLHRDSSDPLMNLMTKVDMHSKQIQEQVAAAERAMVKKTAELEHVRAQHLAELERSAGLRENVAKLADQVVSLQLSVEHQRGLVAGLQADRERLDERSSDMDQALKEQEALIATQKQTLEDQLAHAQQLEEQTRRAQALLLSTVGDQQRRETHLQEELQQSQVVRKQLEQELGKSHALLHDRDSQLRSQEAALSECALSIQSLEKQLEERNSTMTEQDQRILDLETSRTGLQVLLEATATEW